MVMSWVFTVLLGISVVGAIALGRGAELAAAVPLGAQAGVTLAISMAGSLCLWSGVGAAMEQVGITNVLRKVLQPVLGRIFPSSRTDPAVANPLSANICANFLGLGNAATPMGIQAAKQLAGRSPSGVASDELCRLIVLNTASIQLIPATVASVRANLGCQMPYDILPAVWMTSLCSAGAGLIAAWCMGRLWKR